AYAMDGFAFAAEALVAQTLGARRPDLLRRASVMTSIWGYIIAAALAVTFALFGGLLIDLMTTSDTVRDEARTYLPWMVAAPLIGAPAWMLDGIFIGATRARDMRNMMVVSFGIYCVALIALMPSLENHGLWAAQIIFFAARGVTLFWKYPGIERDAAGTHAPT
ncbi:MAG: MATE family efflux transporter, partial [Pseudomonadota bacterium]